MTDCQVMPWHLMGHLGLHRARSTQSEKPQHEQDDHDGANEPDNSIHDAIASLD